MRGWSWISNNISTAYGFGIIQPPNGTSPTAGTQNDTLTYTSSDNSVTITGNSGTKTIDFFVPSLAGYVPYTGATTTLNLGTRNLQMPSGNITDAAGLISIQPNNRRLFSAAGDTTVDYENLKLMYSLNDRYDWQYNYIYSPGNILSASFDDRLLYDSLVSTSFDWQNRRFYDSSGNVSADYGARILQTGNFTGDYAYNWGFGLMYGFEGNSSIDHGSRQLFESTGLLVLDYQNYLLVKSGTTIIDWSLQYLIDDSANTSIRWGLDRDLLDLTGNPSLAWGNRAALDSSGFTSLDWENRTLLRSTAFESLDWGNSILRDAAANTSVNWSTRGLYNSSNALVAGWGSSNAFYLSGTTENSQNGAMWYDTTQKSIQTRQASIKNTLSGVIFTQTATGTVANTTAETAISSTGVGTLTLPADFFVIGKTIRVTGKGIHSTSGTPTLRVKLKLGSTVILDTTAVASTAASNDGFLFEADVACRTTGAGGTVFGQGIYIEKLTSPGSVNSFSWANTATTSLATNASQAISVTVQWGTASASNTTSLTNFIVEVLN